MISLPSKMGTHRNSAHEFEENPKLKIAAGENTSVCKCGEWVLPDSLLGS